MGRIVYVPKLVRRAVHILYLELFTYKVSIFGKLLLFDTSSRQNMFASGSRTIISHARISSHSVGKFLKNSSYYTSKNFSSRSDIFLKNLLMSKSNSPQLHSSFSNRLCLNGVILLHKWINLELLNHD